MPAADARTPENREDVLRRAILEIKAARAAAAAADRRSREPVAVVGVGCRLPGGVSGAEEFWGLLSRGRSAVGEVPGDRWDAAAFFDPEPGVRGRVCSRAGGFLDSVRGFDAGLFGVSPREAVSVDPLQRLVLEVGWEALETAGIAPDGLRGSRTGVYVGVGASDYGRIGGGDAGALDGYAATGVALNFVANRLSFVLGLAGPSLVVDTACSSSLVAVHLAVAGLRAGECDAALAGGVNVLLAPEVSVALSQGKMLSPAGRCATFDAAADGYVRGEGCGLVVLKRLSDAVEAGDDIWGVIRGTAVNQDGKSSAITVPNSSAQQDVISRALGAAGVAPAEVGYVEAHGTGTPLGDPIEVRALARVLGEGRDPGRPVRVGSVKTNIGHLEAAAGIAGFIKALLAVQRGQIPPHLNLSRPNPHIAWDELPVTVPVELTAWPDERRVAGVSAFGFGGTNAHVILENAPVPGNAVPGNAVPGNAVPGNAVPGNAVPGNAVPGNAVPAPMSATAPRPAPAGQPVPAGPVLVKVSGRTPAALAEAAARLADFAAGHLDDGGTGPVGPGPASPGPASTGTAGMGGLAGIAWAAATGRADLAERAAVVAGSRDELIAGLRAIAAGEAGPLVAGLPVAGQTMAGQTMAGQTMAGQAVAGQAVAGRPLAGCAVLRSRVTAGAAPRVAFRLPGDDAPVAGRLAGLQDDPAIAAVLGALRPAAGTALDVLTQAGTELAGTELAGTELAGTELAGTELAGTELAGAEPADPAVADAARYALAVALGAWWRSAGVEPDAVAAGGAGAFAAAALAGVLSVTEGLAALRAARAGQPLPAGLRPQPPRAALCCPGADAPGFWLAVREPDGPPEIPAGHLVIDLAAGEQPRRGLLAAAGRAWAAGASVRWAGVLPRPPRVPRLPTYPFQRDTFWLPEARQARAAPPLRPVPMTLATGTVVTETVLSLSRLPFLAEHRVHGRLVVPGVVLLELVLRTAEPRGEGFVTLENLSISRPLALADDEERVVQAVLTPASEGTATAAVYSRDPASGDWQPHLEATVAPARAGQAPDPVPPAAAGGEVTDGAEFYRRAWHPDFALGPSFRLIRSVATGTGTATGVLMPPAPGAAGVIAGVRPELLLLDACVQLVAAVPGAAGGPVRLGTGYRRIAVHRPGVAGDVRCTAVTRQEPDGSLSGDLFVAELDGTPVAELTGVTFRPVSAATLDRLSGGQPAAVPAPDLAQVRAAGPARRRELVLEHLRALVAQVLGTGPQDVDPQETVSAYADSLMLAELRERLVADLGVTLPLEAFFDESLTALAKLIAGRLPGGRAGRPPGGQVRVMTVAQLQEQAVLGPEITASGPPAAGTPAGVLLTGATGFVGAFLLSELLARQQEEVICLVRAQDEAHALRRVLENLSSYGLDAGAHAGRIVAVPGDLARPLLGLDERSLAALHDRAGSIYHCGAVVKWTYPYAGLEPANVGGTREVLRLATRGAPRPVHFVSTVGVFSSAQSAAEVVRETDELAGSGPLAVGYAQSKWVAEQLVRTAAQRGVPATIHRVNTAGHAVTGAFNRLDHLSMMVKGCIEAGIAPLDAPMPVQPAPVDYVARAMVALAGRPELAGQTFHLVGDQPLGWPEFFDAVEEFGYPLERLSFADWRARITGRTSGTMALLGLVPFLTDAVDQVRLPVSDSALTRRALAGTGISCPPLTAGLIGTYLRAFIDRGFVDPPARVPA